MKRTLRELLDEVASVPDFCGVNPLDINDTNSFGDNALHCVCVWGDLDAVKLLVESGINLEQQGEGGLTPLKVAASFGHKDIGDYLTSRGANREALNVEFKYDREATLKHMKMLDDGIEKLEKQLGEGCNEKMPNKRFKAVRFAHSGRQLPAVAH